MVTRPNVVHRSVVLSMVATLTFAAAMPVADATKPAATHTRAAATATRPAAVPPAPVNPHASRHHPDFNGDGYADLVIGAQGDKVGSATAAGGVWIVYGGSHGTNTGGRHRYLTENTIGRGASSATNDSFGYASTSGDFNGDGYDDLAIGAPGKTINGQGRAGAVIVVYGSQSGIITSNAQFFHENVSGMNATAHANEYFGGAITAGDFNGDHKADLAIGAYHEDVGSTTGAGAVFELFGTRSGLSHAAPLLPHTFTALTPGLHGGISASDGFGDAVLAADFNGDHYSDLAIDVPYKKVGGHTDAGLVHVLRGSPSGLTGTGAQTLTQDTSGIPDSSETNDLWGYTLGAIDINGDGRSELIIGAPGESQGAKQSIGAVTVLWGSPWGPLTTNALFYLLANTTFGQTATAYDWFGSSFAAFDFDGDGRQDLAIGVEGRTTSDAYAGEVVVLHNVGGRLSRSGGFTLERNDPGMVGPVAPQQYFGGLVRGGDWSGNGRDDLAVSIYGLKVGTALMAGGVEVFYGARGGVANNVQQFTANSLGGTPYTNAYLGGYDW